MVSLMDLPTEIKKVLRQVGWLDDLLSMLEGDTSIDFSTGLMPFDFYFNGDEIIFEFSGDDERVTQSDLADAIANIDLFEVVSSLPTSNIKKNRLYLVPNQEQESQNLYDVFLRVNNSWEKVDVTINLTGYVTTSALDTALSGKVDKVTGKGLSTNDFTNPYKSKLDNLESTYATQDGVTADLSDYVKTDDSRLSDSRTPTSHAHGNISNDGKIGTAANKPLITGSNGLVSAGSFGTGANTFCEGNDSRLSDARTPKSHSHDASAISLYTSYANISANNQDDFNDAVSDAFGAISVLLGEAGDSQNCSIQSTILQNDSTIVFTSIGNIVLVEYSFKGNSNSATDELTITNYLQTKFRPTNCTKYFDLPPHRSNATGVRVNITPAGHFGVTPLEAKPIACYGSFFYILTTETYTED